MMDYLLISGIVRDLCITKKYEDLFFNDSSKNLIGITSVIAAATGNGASSTILTSSSNGAEVEIEFFTCRINDFVLSGRFYKVDFADGENIDFVVTKQNWIHEVHSARNPAKNLIWSIPYRTRGHSAQRKHDILSSINISIMSSIIFAIVSYFFESTSLSKHLENLLTFGPISFAIMLIVNALSRWPFYKYSYEATKIFEAFGFEKPSMIDLPKNHNKADKKYYKNVGEPRPWQSIPWRYRYE